MDGSKDSSYSLSKRKIFSHEMAFLDSPNPSQERMSTAHSDASFSGTSNTTQSEKLKDLSKFYPNSKASSKKLQQLIAKSRPEELGKIIESISPIISDLMMDMYGNYMCQTLFHNCSAGQRLQLLTAMRGNLIDVAFHPRGTHALQNLIAMTSLKEEETIYREEFQGRLVEMSVDNNASHIVQRLLVTVNNRYFIIREILGRVEELSKDKLGVCVIKKCCNDPEIMNEILGSCLILIQHPYGNYAVQSILEIWREEVAHEFMSAIHGRVLQLCLQKYASNVIEKAIKIESIRSSILKELEIGQKIEEIIGNQYGCYVLRTLALECDSESKTELLQVFKQATSKVHSQKLKPLWQEILDNLKVI
jgi:Pumilio-family RNA binding repeat